MFLISEVKIELIPIDFNIQIDNECRYYEIIHEGETITILLIYTNPFHNQHLYI